MSHEHPIRDVDKRFIIDTNTRIVTIPDNVKPVLTQYDHNSEFITFEIDRYIEGHDLLKCDKVEIHYNNVASSGKRTSRGVYEAEDFQIDSIDSSKVTFTWKISEMATKYAGTLQFVVAFSCTDEGDLDYRWNTLINSELTVQNGINNGRAVVESYADVLEMWKQDLFGIGDTEEARMLALGQTVMDSITATGEQTLTAIETKGNQTLASIPEDYATLQATVDELLEDDFVSQTSTTDNVITETFDDGRKKVTTIDGQVLTESWYSTDGVLTKSKTITISQNGVTENLTTV